MMEQVLLPEPPENHHSVAVHFFDPLVREVGACILSVSEEVWSLLRRASRARSASRTAANITVWASLCAGEGGRSQETS